jgi:hypothetical protein
VIGSANSLVPRDQWLELKGPAVAGYTYDAHKNLMLKKIKRAKKEVSLHHFKTIPPFPPRVLTRYFRPHPPIPLARVACSVYESI